jgi:tetratricopeptide (TPR) repeat protein
MNQRLTRKEIKRDEFASAVGRSVEYAESHGKTIAIAIGAALLLGALWFGVSSYQKSRNVKANDALAYAMKVYEAPVDQAAPKPNDPLTPSFASQETKRARAKELFTKLRDDFGSVDAADVAGVYLGQIAAQEGDLKTARQLWTDFAEDHRDHMLAGEVQLNLMEMDRQEGKAADLATRLRGLLEQSEPPLPQDVLYHELGKTLEQLGQTKEAVDAYQKIVDEFPRSPYQSEAMQRIGVLDPSRAGRTAVSPFNLPG